MKVAIYCPPGGVKFEVNQKTSQNTKPTLETQRGILGGGPLVKTKHALEKKGVETVLFNPWKPTDDFDIFFVDGSVYEMKRVIEAINLLEKPIVVTPGAYSRRPNWQFNAWSYIDSMMPVDTVYSLRNEIYKIADVITPTSQSEARQLIDCFGFNESKVDVVPLGVDKSLFSNVSKSAFVKKYGIDNYILQVGIINNRKGQSRLITAVEESELDNDVVFVGKLDARRESEANEFLALVNKYSWAHFVGPLDHETMIPAAYGGARMHVLPSKYEFPGMVTLEAAASGCPVISGEYPPIVDYLGDRIVYCDPENEVSIRHAVEQVYREDSIDSLSTYILDNYTWEDRADRLIEIFSDLIK